VVANAAFPVTAAFAPDGRLFYTEKAGAVRVVLNPTSASPQLLATPFVTFPNLASNGEQGLLGLAFDPNFAANRFVYIYYTDSSPSLRNRVVRYTDSNNIGANELVVADNLPVNSNHNGGRIAFGPDGLLYVTIGDAGSPANAQSQTSRAGKLLRFNPDGTIPAGNPVAGNPLFTLGLRNPFGLTFHRTAGTPYVSDNGPNCDDEVNRIVANGNYGWRPSYPCGDMDPMFRGAIVRFTPPIAPTGLVFYSGAVFPEWQNHLFLASFNDGALRRFVVDEAQNGMVLEQQTIISGTFGALIDVTVGPDGNLYLAAQGSVVRVVRGP
jgi:glucose/arabinose dehydrogenase